LYRLIRPLLFALDAETSHRLTLGLLHAGWRLPGAGALARRLLAAKVPELPVNVMGLQFPNPVGLAAGLDKEACCATAFQDMGFGFVELGTVTPRPQPGNPTPRLFRLTAHTAILNRMGFNSGGLDTFLVNLQHTHRHGLIGINLGKNKDTPADRAIDDYLTGMRAVYPYADYITINISSPNTPGLRDLQEANALDALLARLRDEQERLATSQGRRVPLALKIAPDLDEASIDAVAGLLLSHQFDAVIATNTTTQRPGLVSEPLARETGGLSGLPLKPLSTRVIRQLYTTLQGRIPIIGVGGIFTAEDAWEKLQAGAELIQIYSALIYRGPDVVRHIVSGLADRVRAAGVATLDEALQRVRIRSST